MMRASSVPLLALCAWLTTGCNALFFYETTKVSVTLEGKPDSSQPVQGSIGIKGRTALVVPPKKDGEAASMVSSFSTRKEEGLFGKVTLETVLVTGDAATSLGEKTTSTARAVADVPEIPKADENAVAAVRNATTDGNLEELKTIAANPWSALNAQAKKRLGQLTHAGASYDEQLHVAVRKQLGIE